MRCSGCIRSCSHDPRATETQRHTASLCSPGSVRASGGWRSAHPLEQGQPLCLCASVASGRSETMRLLLVGYGKMGKLVDELAREQKLEVVGRIDVGDAEWPDADVAVDFTTA